MTDTLLSLDTLIERRAIEIDGIRYEILSTDELSVIDVSRFARWQRKLEELQQGDELDEATERELEALVDKVARRVLVEVPDAVIANLSGVDKVAVVEVFTALLLRKRMGVAGAVRTAMGNPSTGASLFPGFSAFMGARPSSGWKARLSRWFGRT